MKSLIKRLISENEHALYLIYKYNDLQGKTKIFNKIKRKYIRRKLFYRYHIIIGEHCKIGRNLSLPHPQNIIIGNYAEIGDNCKIFQDVTIGLKITTGESLPNNYPKINDGCTICAGAKILGNVVVQNNTVIAANAVLTDNAEANSLYAGIPAKLKKRYEIL